MFAAFIVACGTTHLLSAITVWIPLYWLDGLIKAITAVISITTAALMLWVIPRALSLPSAAQLQEEIRQRKIAENALRESENKLATVLDNVEAFIYIKDCNYQYQYANQAMLRPFEKTLEDIIGKSDDSFFDADTAAKLHVDDRRVIEFGERLATENIYINNAIAGTYLSVKQALRHADGTIYGLCGIATNITERKKMEEKLRESEAFNLSVLNSLTSYIAVLDVQGAIVAVNNAWIQLAEENGLLNFSLTMSESQYFDICKKIFPQSYGDDAYSARSGIIAVLAGTQESYELEYPCNLANRQHWFHMKVSPLRGSRSGVVINHENISARKQNEAKLNAIFNASIEGIVSYDSAGAIISANAAVETIFGYKPEELMGQQLSKIMPFPSKQSSVSADITKAPPLIQEIEGIHKDGSVVPLDLSIAEYSINNQNYFTNIVRDVSLRKQQEQQNKEHLDNLARVTRFGLMGEMASGIAHEINQPLAAVSNYTQASLNLIQASAPDLAKIAEMLNKVRQQTLIAGQIVHRMREFIKFHNPERTATDINILIHDAVSLCMAELKQHGIRLTLALEQNPPPIFVDHIQIEQVLINLIRNAVDALQTLPAEQQRDLSIYTQLIFNTDIQVRIKDNGPGIQQEQRQQILTPFYTTKINNLGMGLSICRSIIEAHEGTLRFNSLPGKGTTFYFMLPGLKTLESETT